MNARYASNNPDPKKRAVNARYASNPDPKKRAIKIGMPLIQDLSKGP